VNARLRARHRAAFLGLACALPPLAWAALALRAPASIDPAPLADRDEAGGFALRLYLAQGWTSLDAYADGKPGVRVGVSPDRNESDVLLYWSPGEPAGTGLPDDAELVGAIGKAPDEAFELRADQLEGWFSVYSLAKHEVVGSLSIPTEPLLPICTMPPHEPRGVPPSDS
jgi:hypothetical protein